MIGVFSPSTTLPFLWQVRHGCALFLPSTASPVATQSLGTVSRNNAPNRICSASGITFPKAVQWLNKLIGNQEIRNQIVNHYKPYHPAWKHGLQWIQNRLCNSQVKPTKIDTPRIQKRLILAVISFVCSLILVNIRRLDFTAPQYRHAYHLTHP